MSLAEKVSDDVKSALKSGDKKKLLNEIRKHKKHIKNL